MYCQRSPILREICHNTEAATCVPPAEEAFPRALGRPVKHREIYSLSYSGSRHLTVTEREGTETLATVESLSTGYWKKIITQNNLHK